MLLMVCVSVNMIVENKNVRTYCPSDERIAPTNIDRLWWETLQNGLEINPCVNFFT